MFINCATKGKTIILQIVEQSRPLHDLQDNSRTTEPHIGLSLSALYAAQQQCAKRYPLKMMPVESRTKTMFGVFWKVIVVTGDVIITMEVFSISRRIHQQKQDKDEPYHDVPHSRARFSHALHHFTLATDAPARRTTDYPCNTCVSTAFIASAAELVIPPV